MIFGQKLWQISLFCTFKTLFFWSKNYSFFLQNIQKQYILTWFLQKNTNKKNFDFWTKTMVYPLRKMSIFFRLFKTLDVWSRIFFFNPEYQKTIFSNIITSKTLVRKSLNFGQKPWTNLLGKGRFFGPPQNDTFLV